MDTDLVIRAQRGDEQAFASLAVACGDRLHAVAHRILRDIELAEDATQQALLAIWRDLPQLRDPVAHRIPLYVVPAVLSEEESRQHSELTNQWNRAIAERALDRAEEAMKAAPKSRPRPTTRRAPSRSSGIGRSKPG